MPEGIVKNLKRNQEYFAFCTSLNLIQVSIFQDRSSLPGDLILARLVRICPRALLRTGALAEESPNFSQNISKFANTFVPGLQV